MLRILLTAAVVTLTAYLSILYKNQVLMALFFAELLTVLPSAFFLPILCRRLAVRLRIPIAVVERKQEAAIELLVENKNILPLPSIEAKLVCRNHFEKKKYRVKLRTCADARGISRAEFFYTGAHCGKVEVTVKSIRCYDWLHLFWLPLRAKQQAYLAVLPTFREVSLQQSKQNVVLAESDHYDEHRSGDDPSEVFDIRKYRRGDALHRVHWKMTARTDELMVKEFSNPLGYGAVLFLQTAQGNAAQRDDCLDLFFSLSAALLEQQCRHQLVWYDAKEGILRRVNISNQESIYEAMEELLDTQFPQEEQDLRSLYEQQFPNEVCAEVFLFNQKLQLFRGEEEISYETR